MPPDALRALVDDPSGLANEETVLRVVQAGRFTGRDIHSNAFEDQRLEVAQSYGLLDHCASVAVKSVWQAKSGDVQDILGLFGPGAGLAEVSVAALRNLKNANDIAIPQGLMLDPREGAPWHAVVFRLAGGKRPKGENSAIRKVATWFWHPGD